jgi:hypothetical protein
MSAFAQNRHCLWRRHEGGGEQEAGLMKIVVIGGTGTAHGARAGLAGAR